MSIEQALRASYQARGWSIPPIDPAEEARLAEQAKHFPITRLPYAGEKATLKFDRRNYRKTKGTLSKQLKALSFSDYQNGMHIEVRASADMMRLMYTPEFSKNDDQLKLVVAQQAYDYVKASHAGTKHFYNAERVPNGFLLNREALEDLARKATESRKTWQVSSNQLSIYRHVTWCEQHGGYVALRAAIAYKAWRLAKDAHTIGKEMNVSWAAVRQILNRLCMVARRLNLETFPRHPSADLDLVIRPYDFEEVKIKLYKSADEEAA